MSTIRGTTADDVVYGTAVGDRISVGLGNDTVYAGTGDDTIFGGPGLDSLVGGDGNDQIFTGDNGSYSLETVDGGSGDDVIILQARDARIEGGDGLDTVRAVSREQGFVYLHGVERYFGGVGPDVVFADVDASFAETLTGGAGSDFLNSGQGDDLLRGGAGADSLDPNSGHDTVYGGAGFDFVGLVTQSGAVSLLSLRTTAGQTYSSGSIELHGVEGIGTTQGDDHLLGGAGKNELSGGEGHNTLEGGLGDDILQVSPNSTETMSGGAGRDVLAFDEYAFNGKGVVVSLEDAGHMVNLDDRTSILFSHIDGLSGGGSGDALTGDAESNVIGGGWGQDTIVGGDGRDTLYGDSTISTGGPVLSLAPNPANYSDVLSGGAGSDALYGEHDLDTLSGDAGSDTLVGGDGRDEMSGGTGADTFVFQTLSDSSKSTDGSADLIRDLQAGDTIDVSAIDAVVSTTSDDPFRLVSAFDHTAGEAVLTYDAAAGVTHLLLDVDGDGAADMVVDIGGDHQEFTNFAL